MPTVQHDLSHIDPPNEGTDKQRSASKIVVIGVVVSLLIHVVFAVTSAILSLNDKQQLQTQRPLRTQLVSHKPSPPPQDLPKQLVSVAPPKESQKPKSANYSAEYDQSVKEQTRSTQTSMKVPSVASRAQSPTPQSAVEKPRTKTDSQEREKAVVKSESKNGIAMKSPEETQVPRPKLFPSWKDQGYENAAPFNDRLQGVKDANETRLNTLQWAHAGFFNRVKSAVARRWDPRRAIKRYDPKAEQIGKQERTTQILASIDSLGRLVSIRLSRESGVYYLDDEALKAFNEAAPFSNPPKELFASNDTFEFPFGFILSHERGFKFDLDWKPY